MNYYASLTKSRLTQLRGKRVVGPMRLISIGILLTNCAFAQQAFTWQEIHDKFEAANPSLQAARIGIDESRANETTAYLKPNPQITMNLDQINPFSSQPSPNGIGGNSYTPFAYALPFASVSYLFERQGKRELRRDSAQQATDVARSNLADQERNQIFVLRNAFVQSLHAKAVLQLAQDNLTYYDQLLTLNRNRRQAGDIAQVDLDRLELQRVQYESDRQTAALNLRTAKIQLLTLLNDRTPVEQFDVTGPFDSSDQIQSLEELRQIALDARPDLKAALQSVEKAKIDHRLAIANSSTDPIFSVDVARNPPIVAYVGVSVSIPLRIHDRNQGEKMRTELDIARNQKLETASEAQVFNDVDSAYANLSSTLTLLRTYKSQYLMQAQRVRDTISFSYQNGGASLIELLNAQNDYRSTQLNYLNLIGSFMTAASQLNLATGREVVL